MDETRTRARTQRAWQGSMDYLSSKTFFHAPSHLLSSYLSRTCVPTGCQGRIAFRGFFSPRLRNRATGWRRRRERRRRRRKRKRERDRERERDNAHVVCVTLTRPLHPSRTRNTRRASGARGEVGRQGVIKFNSWPRIGGSSPFSPPSPPRGNGGGPLPPITDRPEFTWLVTLRALPEFTPLLRKRYIYKIYKERRSLTIDHPSNKIFFSNSTNLETNRKTSSPPLKEIPPPP